MDAFGSKMHLKLARNTQLVKPGLELETRHDNGDVTRTPVQSDSFFHGREISDPNSFVALSNARGLTGMISLSNDTFFIHPLPNHLAKHVTIRNAAKPHLVYRKSATSPHCLDSSGVASSSTESGKNYDIFSRTSPTELVAHKYLQAALIVDENVEARHGNETAHFLLVLANIVSGSFRDNSIGKIKINFLISRLVIITNKESD
ncbi:A disintegrin and metalloproteinase with thrombospondin motifs 14-like [Pocillopora damicornis]|uniref:A disintegrin and metalloproteinase with thrombospondin motifs 14-like n=1 Tax=Pocillopora damicornis TaxID=46731 RepID=UPI000F553F65|nr:A disintegrin and metalloproteinase with thrombospondin motifs 14-like [Pocillopora damicornis]